MSDPVSYRLDGEIAVIRIDSPPVNALGQAVRAGLMAALRRFQADPAAKLALLYGAGRMFSGGADIREFGKPPQPPLLTEVVSFIESQEKPVACVIHGTALGGGLELALGAHYRAGLANARVGLPEVNIGLLPGAGGTQRLPRLIGVEPAAAVITSGRQIPAAEAAELGLFDTLAGADAGSDSDSDAAESFGLSFARQLLADGAGPRPSRGQTPTPGEPTGQLFARLRAETAKKARGQQSPLHCLEALRAAVELPFEQGLARERELFLELLNSPQREALIHAFFAEREVGKIPELTAGEPRQVRRVGIVGGGTMGSGIAMALLTAGYTVVMLERDAAGAEAGRGRVEKLLAGGLQRGKFDQAGHDRMTGAFAVTTDLTALAEAELIIEAAFEDMEVKKDLFRRLDEVAKPGAVLASNTSYLNIDEIAAVTRRPEDVLGMHFFSPAHVMKLVEVVVAEKTSADVTATAFAVAKTLNKVAVRAGVCDGFIGNRIWEKVQRAAVYMVEDGSSPYDIDRAVVSFGYPMGPFQVSDLAGLDIGWANRKRKLKAGYPGRYGHAFMDSLAEQGRFGQKTGRGIYLYQDGAGSGSPDPEVLALIDRLRAEKGITPVPLDEQRIIRRYLAAMVNESAKVVEDGIALRPLDVDVTVLYGYGFPRWRGGPLKYADMIGPDKILADLRQFAAEDPDFWRPARLLEDLVSRGETFASLNRKTA